MRTLLYGLLGSIIVLIMSHSGHTQVPEGQSVQRVLTPAKTSPAMTLQNEPTSPLTRYGSQLFLAREPSADVLVGGMLPLDYRLGPGDGLTIYLGGKAQEQFQIIVSIDGQVFVPSVGVLQVMGLRLNEFTQLLQQKLNKVYSNFTLEVMLTVPKQVSAAVIGEVAAPGNYAASGLSSVVDFISVAQGPSELASLRNIQIFRRDSLFASLDLYDFLLRPAGFQNFCLQSGDKIFVPVVASTVQVIGEVNRPAIYELNPNRRESVRDLVILAGGFTSMALRDKVELSRLNRDGTRELFFIDLDDNSEPRPLSVDSVLVKDNDCIRVFSLADQVPADSVEIHGEVRKPGIYPYQKNMSVGDLLLQAGGLMRGAYPLEAEIAKIDPANQVKTMKVNLELILSGDKSQDVILEPDDHVFVRKFPGWKTGQLVQVVGEVKFPGMYAIIDDSTTLSHVIADAGGFTEDALIREMRLIRTRKTVIEDKEFTRLAGMARSDMSDSEYDYLVMKQNSDAINEVVVDFYKLFVNKDAAEDVLLKDGDVIHIPKRPNVVYVSGRVSNSGGILFKSDATAKYYIQKAGGFTWDADKGRAKVIKVNGEIRSMDDIKSLEAGDRIWVPRKKEMNYWQIFRDFVMVAGQLAAIYLVIHTATR